MSEIESKTPDLKSHTGILSAVSLILSVFAIIAVILSIRRIEAVQDLTVCLIAETPGYRVIHSLCTIFPTGALVAGFMALKRMLRARRKLSSIIVASGGVIISLSILIIYWLNLAHLASGGHGHVH